MTPPTWTRSGPASSRLRPAASSARSWRSSRHASTTRRRRATYLAWLLRTFQGYPLAVELRHRSWSDAAPETRGPARRDRPPGCRIDEPKFESVRAPAARAERGPLMYVRLHGRNAAQWWITRSRRIATTTCIRRVELAPIIDKLRAARAPGAEALSLHEQPLRGTGGGQRDDGARDAGRARHGADAVRARLGVPDARGSRGYVAPRTVTLTIRSVTSQLDRRRPCR